MTDPIARQQTWNTFWSRKRDIARVYPSSPSLLRTILTHFDPAGRSVVEVGAGSGRDSLELACHGAQVTVLDFAHASLDIVAEHKTKRGLSRVNLVRADGVKTPFPDEAFDLVFHQGLLEHFREPLELLKENYRILKPGGYCLCDVPQTIHPYTLLKKILITMDWWFAGWETQYTMPSLKSLMARAGFQVFHTYGDWMRPCLLYRLIRELLLRVNVEVPLYPLEGSRYQRWKDAMLDLLTAHPAAQFTQVSIGVLAQKPDSSSAATGGNRCRQSE